MAHLRAKRITFLVILGLALSPHVKAASPEIDQLFDELLAAYDDSRLEDIERIYKKMLPLSRQELGDDHPQTLSLMNDMADFLRALDGREAEAEMIYQEELTLRRERFGDADPETSEVIRDLKWLYRRQGHNDKATSLYEHHLPIMRSALGDTHAQVIIMMAELGNLYEAQGRAQDAKAIYEEVLPLMQQSLGKSNTQTLETMTDLAKVTWETRTNLFENSVCELARLVRAEHFGYCVLAGDATSMFEQALQLSLSRLQSPSVTSLVSLFDEASQSWRIGQYDEAIRLHEKALEISRENLGTDHSHTDLTFKNLVFLYEVTGQWQKGVDLYRRLMEPLTE